MLLMLAQLASAGVPLSSNDKNWLGGRPTYNTTDGSDFWLTFMTNNAIETKNPSLNLTIYAVAQEAVTIQVEVGTTSLGTIDIPEGGGYGKLEKINPELVYIQASETQEPLPRGVHVYCVDSISFSCYALCEAGSGTSSTREASLILPTRALGKEYYVQTYQTDGHATEFAVVATESNTTVQITPKAKTDKASPAGTPITATLNRGGVYLIRSNNPVEEPNIDLSGSSICADKPVAVFQGNDAVKIAAGDPSGFSENNAFEQTLPADRWGKEFYVSLPSDASSFFYNIIAAKNNTEVTISGFPNPIPLEAGQSIEEAYSLDVDAAKDVKITSNNPIMVNTYRTCGGTNVEKIVNPGKTIYNYWGNPTSALMPSWEMRTKKMSFFTDTIACETKNGTYHMYLQVFTKTADVSKITLDGANVSSSFSALSADASMSVANIELTEKDKHTLETTGDGFVGHVFSITSESRAYHYTLGYSPAPFGDTLYLTDGAAMIPTSYDLPKVEGHGWYQRQWDEWIEGTERLDTAITCDSSTVSWTIETHPERPVTTINWNLYDVTDGKHEAVSDDYFPMVETPAEGTKHSYEYKFILPEEEMENRHQFFEYELEVIVHRDQVLCGGEDIDTFRTVTRVTRKFNDTIWHAICMGDTLYFFNDSLINQDNLTKEDPEGIKDSTAFIATKAGTGYVAPWKYNVSTGPHTFTRHYISQFGCDSFMTLQLYVCDTFRFVDEIHLCSNDSIHYHGEIFCGEDFSPIPSRAKVITDEFSVLEVPFLTQFCGCQTDEKNHTKYKDKNNQPFEGCDSIYELHLTIHPSYDLHVIDTLNYKEYPDSIYRWKIERDGVTRDSLISLKTKKPDGDSALTWSPYAQAWVGDFSDTLRTKTCDLCNGGDPKGCDSINSLKLIIPPVYHYEEDTVWCRLSYDWSTHTTVYRDFQWFGHHDDIIYTKGGDYYDSCVSRYGADSIYHLHLVYSQAETPVYDLVEATVCQDTLNKFAWTSNDGFLHVDTIPQDKAGTFYYVDESRCDSIYALKLIVLPTYFIVDPVKITQEEVYTWPVNGKTYGGSKTTLPHDSTIYTSETVVTLRFPTYPVNGQTCDSIRQLIIQMGNVYRDTLPGFACGNEYQYEWWGKDHEGNDSLRKTIYDLPDQGQTRIYTDPYTTVLGDDSIFYLNLYRAPIHDSTDILRVCQADGSTFAWPGHEGHKIYDANGELVPAIPAERYGDYWYTDSLQTVGYGCDSIWHLHLYVDTVYHFTYEDTTCQFSDYVWPNQHIDSIDRPITTPHTGDSIYTATYHTIHGCDSIWTLKLHIDTVYLVPQLTTDTFMCDKDSFVFDGHPRRVLYGFQCPDIPAGVAPTDIISIPEGATFTSVFVNGFILSSLGCDSAVEYNLYVNRTYSETIHTRICQPSEGQTWQDSVYNWVGHETVWDVHNSRYIRADSIPRFVKGDTTYLYIDSLRTTLCEKCPAEKGGCDSLFFLYLTIDSTYHFYDTIHICENEDYTWQGRHYVGDSLAGIDLTIDSVRAPGIYHERVQYEATHACDTCFCDSIYYLELHVHPVYFTPLETSFCDNEEGHHIYEFSDTRGNYYRDSVPYAPHRPVPESDTASTFYKPDTVVLTHLLKSVDGCDSTVSLRITILPTYRFVAQSTSCAGEAVEWRGGTYYTADVYYDSLKTAAGCDSVFVLEYYIKPVVIFTRFDTICESETFIHSDTLWYTNGEYTVRDQLIWEPGMTKPKPYADVVFRTWDNTCDSLIYRYYLTICDTFMYHAEAEDLLCSADTFYSAELDHAWVAAVHYYDTDRYVLPFDTTYVDSLQTVMGCDSLYFLHAFVLPSYRHIVYDTICENETYTFRDMTFRPTSYGDTIVRDILSTEFLCDSIFELRLSVYPKFYYQDFDTICADETYPWHDVLYKDLPVGENLLTDSLKTIHDCDSVYHMYLFVKDTTYEVRFDTICYGDTLTVTETGHIYTVAGNYKDTTLNDVGCHHFIYTHLTAIPPTVPTVWAESPMCQDETAFELYYTYTSHYPIAYSLYFDSVGLSMGFEDMEDVPITEYTNPMIISVPIPYRDGEKTNYPRPDIYAVRLVLDNGICQHKETDCFDDSTFMMSYPLWLTQQRYGDVIALLNEKYNGGYTWSSYQWYQGDTKLEGQTNPYLYIPTGLVYGEQYHVRLTRQGETEDFPTCPLTVTLNPQNKDYGPTLGYLDVAPTCITPAHPYTTILSRHDGNYRITTSDGSAISSGDFHADATQIQVPSVAGMYIVQLWSDDTPEEPYRAIKIVVRDICETCATSF